MGSIVLLDEQTINQIAAGEVIERPANVVKEMCENSIDAGATSITVEIENGGISLIRITDNGKGIAPDDIAYAFERHATSKIRRAEDLLKVSTMGFRGEALASIASVSKIEMTTRTKEQDTGIKVWVENGEIVREEECGAPIGTTITVNELFFNTPVRYKFLKKDFTEAGYIEDAVSKLALVHPEISFKFINNKKTSLQTSGNNDLKSVIYSVYGKDVANNLLEVDSEYEGYKVTGMCGKPEIARSSRTNQLFFVNDRNIRDKILSSAVDKAYGTLLHEGRFAFCVLNIKMSPELVDVNVHPAKLEVRFQEEGKVFSAVHIAIKNALFSNDLTVIDDEETLKEKENGLREEPKKGFFDKVRPREENIAIKNFEKVLEDVKETTDTFKKYDLSSEILKAQDDDILEETPKNNIVKLDFQKEIEVLKENKLQLNEEVEGYVHEKKTASEDEYINLSKLDFDKKKEEDNNVIDLNKFSITDEDIARGEEKDEYLNKNKLFDVKEDFGKVTSVPDVEGVSSENQESIFESLLKDGDSLLPDYQIIGVAFLTYIFVQIEDEVYIFDQHAAHERVLYEKVKKNYYSDGGKESQMLLLPDVLELSKKDMSLVLEHMDMFKNAGFELEEFGDNTIKIVGVPAICYEMNTRDLFLDIIDGLEITNKTTTEEVENRFLATVACKAAVKANMKLSDKEIKDLFDELLLLENPFTCPHGRPTAIRLTKDEIEKKFKRKGF